MFKTQEKKRGDIVDIFGEEYVHIRSDDLKHVNNLYNRIVYKCCQGEIYGSSKYNYIHIVYSACSLNSELHMRCIK